MPALLYLRGFPQGLARFKRPMNVQGRMTPTKLGKGHSQLRGERRGRRDTQQTLVLAFGRHFFADCGIRVGYLRIPIWSRARSDRSAWASSQARPMSLEKGAPETPADILSTPRSRLARMRGSSRRATSPSLSTRRIASSQTAPTSSWRQRRPASGSSRWASLLPNLMSRPVRWCRSCRTTSFHQWESTLSALRGRNLRGRSRFSSTWSRGNLHRRNAARFGEILPQAPALPHGC